MSDFFYYLCEDLQALFLVLESECNAFVRYLCTFYPKQTFKKLRKILFILSKKLLSFLLYSNFCRRS